MAEIDRILEINEQEKQAFEAFCDFYSLHNPPPEKISTNVAVDWWARNSKMLLSFIATLAIVIGSRTGWSIYTINKDEGFGTLLSVMLAVLLVWSVEGFIAYYGLSRARHLHINFLEKSIGTVAMMVGLILSAVAGLDYVIGIAEKLQVVWGDAVDTILSLLLSVGLTFILYGISEFAGRARWEHENMPQLEEVAFQKELKKYNQQLETDWKSSPDYLQLKGEQIRRAKELEYDIENAHVGRSKLRRERQQLELQLEKDTVLRQFSDKPSGNSPLGDGSVRQEVIDCIVDWKKQFGELPRQTDILNNTSASKGYVSKLFSKEDFIEELDHALAVNANGGQPHD